MKSLLNSTESFSFVLFDLGELHTIFFFHGGKDCADFFEVVSDCFVISCNIRSSAAKGYGQTYFFPLLIGIFQSMCCLQ